MRLLLKIAVHLVTKKLNPRSELIPLLWFNKFIFAEGVDRLIHSASNYTHPGF